MADETKTHPLKIGPTYAGQFLRPEDGIRAREEEERKQVLRDFAAEGTVPHAAAEEYAEAWDEEIAKYATETTDEPEGHPVDGLIVQAVKNAGARVTESELSLDERLASLVGKAVAQELRATQDDPEDGSAEWAEQMALEKAEIDSLVAEEEADSEEEEDVYIGVDEEGRDVYQNADGVQYILAED